MRSSAVLKITAHHSFQEWDNQPPPPPGRPLGKP